MDLFRKIVLGFRALRRSLQLRNYYLKHAFYIYKQIFGKRFFCRKFSGLEKHSGAPLQLYYLGEGDSVGYLKGLLFQDTPEETTVDSYSLLEIVRGIRPELNDHDLWVRELTPRVMKLSRSTSRFIAPEWVEQEIALDGAWDDVVMRFRKNTRSTDLRKVRKYNFTYDVVTDRKSIEYFYDRLYLPYVSGRFQDAAQIINRDWLAAVAVGSGLLRVLKDGKFVAGAVLHYARQYLDWIWIGALTDHDNDLEKGTFSALYYHSINHAHAMGFKRMKMGNTRPFLNDGVYRYKRKWGAHLTKGRYADTRLLFDFNFNSPACRQWLASSPFLTERDNGFVANVFCLGEEGTEKLIAKMKDIVSPGIAEFNVYCTAVIANLPETVESCGVRQIPIDGFISNR